MKTFLIALVLGFVAISAHADEKLISVNTVTLPVDVSIAKVRKTNAGYGAQYLVKILVPELAAETIMNHRNEGEGAPCLATTDITNVSDLIGNNPGIEHPRFEIRLSKITYLRDNKTCAVSLREDITTNVRGFNFFHTRTSPMPDRVAEDCK